MIKKGSLITIIFIVSSIVQLASQILITRVFGAKLDIEIFLAAVSLPTIFVTVIYGTLNDAFLPLFIHKKGENTEESDRYFTSTIISVSVLFLFIAWVGGFFTKPMSEFFFSARGTEFVENVSIQMRYLLYSLPLATTATLSGAYWYAHKQFHRFPATQLVGNVVNVLTIFALYKTFGTWSLLIAFILSILVQMLIIFPIKSISFVRIQVPLIPLLTAWIPLIIANLALRSDTVLMRSFAAQLPEGYLVYVNIVSRIFSLVVGVMTIGIQVMILTHLIEYFQEKKYELAAKTIYKSKLIAVGATVGVVFATMFLAPFVIKMLFVGGKFTQQNANIVNSIIPLFVLPAIGWGLSGVFFQPLLALRKYVHLAILNIIALIFAWTGATLVNSWYGGLAAITSGLIILLFTGIIGSEIIWQYNKKKLFSTLT